MLYFRALFGGLDALPDADPGLRRAIDERAAQVGWPALHAELATVDPRAAGRIHANDSQRIQRALEVYELTGRPISDWQGRGVDDPLPWPLLKIALIPGQREVLHERIAARFAAMLEAGLLAEVRALHARGDLGVQHSAVRAVGYRQLWEHLEGRVSLDEAVRSAVTATRRLAKRQLTWLRREADLAVFDPFEPQTREKIIALVSSWGGNGVQTLC